VLLLGAFLTYGLVSLFAYQRVVTRTLSNFPEPWARVFIAAMSIGAAMYLYSAMKNTPSVIVKVERAAHWLLASLFLIYAMWSVDVNGSSGFAFSLVLTALAGASIWRLLQIRTFRRAAAAEAERKRVEARDAAAPGEVA
jgi:hypothetical protein